MQTIGKNIILLSITTFLSVPAMAAEAGSDRTPNINITLYSLVSIMLLILFVIGMLAFTMKQLSLAVKDKIKKDRKEKMGGKAVLIGLLFLTAVPASSFAETSAEVAIASAQTTIDGIPSVDFYLLVAVIALELIVTFALAVYIHLLLRMLKGTPEADAMNKATAAKARRFWDKFNNLVPEESESELLLDHNYDGIQELDNSLPPWWKYGFYLTIVVAVIYIYRFHFSHEGASQQQEYEAEMVQGEEEKAAYLAKSANNVDENNVILLTDGDAVGAGKEIFVKNCAACHLPDGGGNVGPNLTDDYWLHGGSIKDVFKSIKYGWQDKGMKSWKDDLSPSQIQQLASFVKSLKGSHPATPKSPQGDLYIEANTNNKASAGTDSAIAIK